MNALNYFIKYTGIIKKEKGKFESCHLLDYSAMQSIFKPPSSGYKMS
jgi:hypothetical protein